MVTPRWRRAGLPSLHAFLPAQPAPDKLPQHRPLARGQPARAGPGRAPRDGHQPRLGGPSRAHGEADKNVAPGRRHALDVAGPDVRGPRGRSRSCPATSGRASTAGACGTACRARCGRSSAPSRSCRSARGGPCTTRGPRIDGGLLVRAGGAGQGLPR